jgi:2-polyprenyl-3-methyl-5-hydroxy-6-metoxy-1,4-benzoquinol methylase
MSVVFHQKCPICASASVKKIFIGHDYSHTRESFEVVRCETCSFTFTQNAPGFDSIGAYYESENYVSHSDTKEGLFYQIYHTVRRYMLGQKRKMVEKAAKTKKGKILDVGCGTGYFLNEMQKRGWDCSGIEQDDAARTYGAEKFDLQVSSPQLINELEVNSLDAVSMWHVLEHVHHLDDYLVKIKKALKPKGTLVVAVPNHDSYDAKHYKKYWAAWDLPIHLWHFTPKSMDALMSKHGLTITAHYALPFDSFYVSILSEQYKGGNAIKGLMIGTVSFIVSLFNVKKCSSVVYIITKT